MTDTADTTTVDAIYVSVWDGGIQVRTSCKYNTATGAVSDVEVNDVDGLEVLEDEYVELADGRRIDLFDADADAE